MKKFLVLLLGVVMALFCFTSCDVINSVLGGGEDNGVKVYSVEAKFGNSAEVNQWKNIYLVDEDTYILTVNAVDSQDPDRVTADFYMSGSYELEGNVLTLKAGYGYVFAMSGDTPIQMPVTPGENGTANAMYAAMMGTTGLSFTLNEDGTFVPVEA